MNSRSAAHNISAAPQSEMQRGHAEGVPRWKTYVPLWTGRTLDAAAVFLLVSTIAPLAFSTTVWLTVYYLDIAWLTSQPTLFNAGLLFVLGRVARQRKRAALWAFVTMLTPTIVAGVYVAWKTTVGLDPYIHLDLIPADGSAIRTADVVAGAIALSLVILLISCREAFSAAAPACASRYALIAVTIGIATSMVVGRVLLSLSTDAFTREGQRWWWLLNTAIGSQPNQIILTSFTTWPTDSVSLPVVTISAVGVVVGLLLYTQSTRSWLRITADQELGIRGLLARDGDKDSLGYFATRRDKAVVFSPDGKAAVSYGVFSGVALASGNPLGDPASWPAAIDAWHHHALHYGWGTAVVATTERGARAYERAGMSTVVMGDEAVIDTEHFSLSGPVMAPVRCAVRRTNAAGYTVLIRRVADLTADELRELRTVADRWRGSSAERGFSMALGRFGDLTDCRYTIVTATDAAGRTCGLLGFVPWGRHGLSLDLMRRSPDAVNGVTELMVTTLARVGPTMAIHRISLNFAIFRDALERGARTGASRSDRARRRGVLLLSRFWQLDSLYRSNAKYQPHWHTRYLCHGPGVSHMRAIVAAARAEGFLRGPRGRNPVSRTGGVRADAAFVDGVRAIESAERLPDTSRPLGDHERARLSHLTTLRDHGIDPYPVAVTRNTSIEAIITAFRSAPTSYRPMSVAVVGRVTSRRKHGGVTFIDLREGTGELQARVDSSLVPDADLLIHTTDLGDLLAVRGDVVLSARSEPILEVTGWEIAAKSLVPPPNRRTGLVDPDSRVRLRHIDIATRDHPREVLLARSRAVRALRKGLCDREFVEVETPILQPIHGGANARPFRTHINAYDADLSLRIAPELALKRLTVAGLERVFEIGRNFRNEGADATHNPEFTAIEAYQAFADYHTMRDLARDLILLMAQEVHGAPQGVRPDGSKIQLDIPWPVVGVHQAVAEATGENITVDTPAADLRALCIHHRIVVPPEASAGHLVDELYENLVEPRTENPTFYIYFPVETSPLARRHRQDARLAERWDLVAFGTEIGTAYSELTDPVDQRIRLTEQSTRAAAGNPDAMEIDTEFLNALAFGMPPTGGLGMGVDRIIMLLTGVTIRETLTFPFVRPDAQTAYRPRRVAP